MRIAYISNSTIPSQKANSVHVMKMCNALSKNKIEVSLYCGSEDIEDKEVFSKYGVESRFKLCRIYQKNLQRKLIPNSIYLGLITYLKLSKKLERRSIDFLYGRSIYGLFLLRNKYKFIYESHMPPREGFLMALEKRLLKNKNCLFLVVISKALKNKYLELFPWLESNKIVVMHDAADEVSNVCSEKSCGEKLNLDGKKDEVVIGYLGHLYFGKCMEVIIEIAKMKRGYTFHIVGGTDYWVKFWNDKLSEFGLNNIRLYGYVENNKIGEYYNCFDICLLPFSKNIYYDKKKKDNIGSWISPLKLFEAMSYGKAILASKLPTIEEVLNEGVDSFLVDPDNIEGWIHQLDLLIEDKPLRDKLGNNALENFKNNFTWDIRAKNVISLYKKEDSNDKQNI